MPSKNSVRRPASVAALSTLIVCVTLAGRTQTPQAPAPAIPAAQQGTPAPPAPAGRGRGRGVFEAPAAKDPANANADLSPKLAGRCR